MIAWLRARTCGGRVILRMEDLDHPRDKPGAASAAVDDLRWLGFDWDASYVQSERKSLYRSALDHLVAQGLAYPCICSRKDVESAQSAPHAGEQLHYPGTCRGRFSSWQEACAALNGVRQPCWRFAVPDGARVKIVDGFAGELEQDVARTLGDFPLARDEGGAGYTLACTVDDLVMGVTEVVRGDDLLPATPAQVLLAEAFRSWPSVQPFRRLSYFHVPLVVGKDGKRLAKRHGDTRIATYRAEGRRPEEIVGFLAASCGWAAPGEAIGLKDLCSRFDVATLPKTPLVI